MYLDFSVIAEFLSFILGDQAFLGAHTIYIYSKCSKKTNVFSHKKVSFVTSKSFFALAIQPCFFFLHGSFHFLGSSSYHCIVLLVLLVIRLV